MINFLHAADLHLDTPFAGLSPEQASQQRIEQRKILSRLSELCHNNHCQLLFLSGDLFDGKRIYRNTLDCLRDALAECDAEVFISPGNHDYCHSTSPYLTETWPENVHIFTSEQLSVVRLDAFGCNVYGAAFCSPNTQGILKGFHIPPEDENYVNFMVLHGDPTAASSQYNSISTNDIAASGLDYLALGHIHQASPLLHTGSTFYAWPGCPMGRGFDETGTKGVFLGQAEKGEITCRFQPLGMRRYENLIVQAGSDPLKNINSVLPNDTLSHIYRIILTGESEHIDTDILFDSLKDRFYALQLQNQTFPPLTFWTHSGNSTLEGLSLHTLSQTLTRCETDEQRRTIELAARRIAEICEGREMPKL